MWCRSDTLQLLRPVPSDIDIAQSIEPLPIKVVAEKLLLAESDYSLYGSYKAKVHSDLLKKLPDASGKYICVTGISPTPLGEGKTTTTIGLCQALGKYLNKRVFTCLRQPSMGPTFGIKGGAAGGGYSQVIPMDQFNLHLTGDIHAVSLANNLLAAAIDTRIFHESTQSTDALFDRLVPIHSKTGKREFSDSMKRRLDKLGIPIELDPHLSDERARAAFARLNVDEDTIMIHRVVDVNDRFLRKITIGENSTENHPRQTQFDISVGSEVMAILALSRSLADLRQRLREMVCCFDREGHPLTADDFGVAGAMAVLLKDAFDPTLMQTLEGTPVFVHAGPFANIAHGNSSIIADKLALRLVGPNGYVVTEAGFGADIGFEKFCNIKCRMSGLIPNCAVLVATVRALKAHGGGPPVVAGRPLAPCYLSEDLGLLTSGCCNLQVHIQNTVKFGIPVIVCVNARTSDTDAELQCVCDCAMASGAFAAVVATHWADGGVGAIQLAKAVLHACDQNPLNGPIQGTRMMQGFSYLYPLSLSLKEKVEIICRNIYGASGTSYTEEALVKLAKIEKSGYTHLPVCMAKTQYSLSHDASLKGAPKGFMIPIKNVQLYSGAGFVTFLCGSIVTMPGLSTRPAFFDVDLDVESGRVMGLS